jgi:hypothetical protein
MFRRDHLNRNMIFSKIHQMRLLGYECVRLLQPLRTNDSQFQKIFVIGLPSRTDRRDSMSLAAAYTGLEIEYVDGVTHVENKTLPPGGLDGGFNAGSIQAWRAHMNVMRLSVAPTFNLNTLSSDSSAA